MEKTVEYYRHYVADPDFIVRNAYPAEHAWISSSFGNDCDYLGDPYINNCGFDAVLDMLQHFYGENIKPARPANSSSLFRFGQDHYVVSGTPALISLGPAGYAYIPYACYTATCKLHVSFHGCNQDLETIGESFVQHTGLNEYAESNNIVVLYPQVRKSSTLPLNPYGYETSELFLR